MRGELEVTEELALTLVVRPTHSREQDHPPGGRITLDHLMHAQRTLQRRLDGCRILQRALRHGGGTLARAVHAGLLPRQLQSARLVSWGSHGARPFT